MSPGLKSPGQPAKSPPPLPPPSLIAGHPSLTVISLFESQQILALVEASRTGMGSRDRVPSKSSNWSSNSQ